MLLSLAWRVHVNAMCGMRSGVKIWSAAVNLPCCWPVFIRIIRRRRDILMHEQVESAIPLQPPRQAVTRHLRFNSQQTKKKKILDFLRLTTQPFFIIDSPQLCTSVDRHQRIIRDFAAIILGTAIDYDLAWVARVVQIAGDELRHG